MRRFILILLIFLLPSASALEVEAKGACVLDAQSGRVIFAQNENEMLPMASTTKIMTCLLTLENAALDETVTAGKNAAGVTGTSIYLSEGEKLTVEQMLYGLMLRSGNDAAVALAEHVAGSVEKFAEMMNARAKQIGADANFVNPHGLDAEGHRASALGMALIMREAIKNEEFVKIASTKTKTIPWVGNDYDRSLANKNKLLTSYEGASAGKTGYTSGAGRCLVFSATRDGMTLVGAVLNCPTWFDTATALLDYGFENFKTEKIAEAGEGMCALDVSGGEKRSISLVAREDVSIAVKKDSRVVVRCELPPGVNAPVEKGMALGRADVYEDGVIIGSYPLYSCETVYENDMEHALKRVLRGWAR